VRVRVGGQGDLRVAARGGGHRAAHACLLRRLLQEADHEARLLGLERLQLVPQRRRLLLRAALAPAARREGKARLELVRGRVRVRARVRVRVEG